MNLRRVLCPSSLVLFVVCCLPAFVIAQNSVTVLAGAELTQVVPTSFYFQGLSAPTQMRNATAARFGTKRFVIAGLVDTSGYAADVRAKYEGFFITDSPVAINGSDLGTGGPVVFVGAADPGARPGFDDNLVAVMDELADAIGSQSDAVLVNLDFFGNSNKHRVLPD